MRVVPEARLRPVGADLFVRSDGLAADAFADFSRLCIADFEYETRAAPELVGFAAAERTRTVAPAADDDPAPHRRVLRQFSDEHDPGENRVEDIAVVFHAHVVPDVIAREFSPEPRLAPLDEIPVFRLRRRSERLIPFGLFAGHQGYFKTRAVGHSEFRAPRFGIVAFDVEMKPDIVVNHPEKPFTSGSVGVEIRFRIAFEIGYLEFLPERRIGAPVSETVVRVLGEVILKKRAFRRARRVGVVLDDIKHLLFRPLHFVHQFIERLDLPDLFGTILHFVEKVVRRGAVHVVALDSFDLGVDGRDRLLETVLVGGIFRERNDLLGERDQFRVLFPVVRRASFPAPNGLFGAFFGGGLLEIFRSVSARFVFPARIFKLFCRALDFNRPRPETERRAVGAFYRRIFDLNGNRGFLRRIFRVRGAERQRGRGEECGCQI